MNTLTWGAAPSDSPVHPTPAVSVCASLGVFSSLPCYPSQVCPWSHTGCSPNDEFFILRAKVSFLFICPGSSRWCLMSKQRWTDGMYTSALKCLSIQLDPASPRSATSPLTLSWFPRVLDFPGLRLCIQPAVNEHLKMYIDKQMVLSFITPMPGNLFTSGV